MYNAKFVNAETGEETIVELTQQEIDELEIKTNLYKQQIDATATQKTALLTKLGITEEEAKLLLS
jgi:hypothetical protein